MYRISCLLLALLCTPALSKDSTEVRNVKCKGGWIREGIGKVEVISYCGEPKYTEVISGANSIKREDLLYTIKRKDYIFSLYEGKVVRIGMVK